MGEILLGWNIIVFYVYIDVRVIKDDNLEFGNLFEGVFFNLVSLWLIYEI